MSLSRHQNRKSCVSANCTKRKSRLRRQFTQFNQPNTSASKAIQKDYNNASNSIDRNCLSKSYSDPFKQQLKYLIAQNAEYFQSKVRISDKIGPNKYRFKIPTKTPMTIYRKHYEQKHPNLSVDNIKLNRNDQSIDRVLLRQNQRINGGITKNAPSQTMLMKTTYQKQFIKTSKLNKNKHKRECSNQENSLNHWMDNDAPRFFQTQNNHFYLNWGPNNIAASMKPSNSAVGNTMPFDGRTVYKNDFKGKIVPRVNIIVPQPSLSRTQSSLMVNKSYYTTAFCNKQNLAHEPSMKQNKQQNLHKNKKFSIKPSLNFKGASQYRSQFKKVSNKQNLQNSQQMTKQDLCALILDL